MIDQKSTYKDLENQLVELEKLNRDILFQFSMLNKEKQELTIELSLARKKIAFELKEKQRRYEALIIASKAKQDKEIEFEAVSKKLTEEEGEKVKRAAELIISNIELLRLTQLNEDKDSFISILAHELKSPFNSILGFLDLLIENIHSYDIDAIEFQLGLVSKSARNAFALLDDILTWIKASSGKISYLPEKINFRTMCNNVIESIRPVANAKDITINYVPDSEICFHADINMLKTILRNFISNSIKFTNRGGHIDLYAEQNNRSVTISVSDNGIGIEPNLLKRIFDISQDVSTPGTENESGTGLGLLLCKEFVEKHGGKIWAESKVGEGSDFKFSIPLSLG